MIGEVAVADQRANEDASVGRVFDFCEVEAGDVDESARLLDVVLHEIDEVGAAAEKLCAARGDGVESLIRCGYALIGEWIHAGSPFLFATLEEIVKPAAARTAATMFGYAPHRQMLPLMRSRISSSVRAGPEA